MKVSVWLAAAGLVALVSTARAEGDSKVRFYFGVTGFSGDLDGDFDGDTVLTQGSESIAVPAFERAFGGGLQLGFRRQSTGSVDPGLEVKFTHSRLDGEHTGSALDATLATLGVDGKLFFNPKASDSWRPFLTAGVFVPWLHVEDGALDGLVSGDADFAGVGYNLGGGISVALGSRFSLDLSAVYRTMAFSRVEGLRDDGEIEDPLYSGDLVPAIAINFFLN